LSRAAFRDTIDGPNSPWILKHMPRRKFAWATLPDEDLLDLRLKDLKVEVDGTWLADCLRDLHGELEERGIEARPHAWISSEWFSPENTPGIAIPFYLAHPRLMQLERKMIIDVEGGTWSECMRILRHEAGHVVQHSYQLQRRRRWQELFGLSSKRYPRYYRPNPASRNFVQHLRLWYAQSHPDEDFAETFAVWLRPRSNWRSRYDGWPALKKLEYVDELMMEIAGQPPLLTSREEVDPLGRLTETLGEHYRKKQALYAFDTPTTYDRDLLRLFSADPKHHRSPAASSFIRRNRARIRRLVSKWTGEYQLTLDAVLDEIVARCRELDLRAVGSERQLVVEFTVLLTAKTMHALFGPSRRRWIAL
jgi:Putative zinc-binding metallo-peptidase